MTTTTPARPAQTPRRSSTVLTGALHVLALWPYAISARARS
jgi:hypothetical protein